MKGKESGFKFGDFLLPQIEITYHPNVKSNKRPDISRLGSAGDYFLRTWDKDTIATKENVRIILVSHQYRALGLYELTIGIHSSKLLKYILLPALRANSCAVCIGINHVSGMLKATNEELAILNKLIEAGKNLGIDVWDFVLVSKDDYFSFRKQGLLGDKLIHDSIASYYNLKENIRNAVKVNYQKNYIKEIIPGDLAPKGITNYIRPDNLVSMFNVPAKATEKLIPIEKNSCDLYQNQAIPFDTSADMERLRGIVSTIKNVPSFLQGPVRNIKIVEQYREGRFRSFFEGRSYSLVPKLVLMGKWLQAAGFNSNNRVQVIPLHQMLIIIPE